MGHLRIVFQVKKEHQLYAKYSKCEFLLRLVAFLVHIVRSEGIDLGQKKRDAVKNLPRPFTPTNIRSFNGLAGYYRRFIDKLSSFAYPIKTFTQKFAMFECLEACERRSKR